MSRAERGVRGERARRAAVLAAPRPGPLPDSTALRNDARAELMAALVWWLAACCLLPVTTAGNPDAKRLYDDLLSNYNKLVRPVVNTTDVLRVCIKLKLSQLIDVVSVLQLTHRFFCYNVNTGFLLNVLIYCIGLTYI